MNFTAFFSYIFLTAFTPGPNNIMSMTNAGKNGFKKGFRLTIGIMIGFLAVMSLSAIFSSLLYSLIPAIKPFMLGIGTVYILWLAWSIVRDKPHESKKSSLELNSIFTGAVLQLVNVKVILYGITAMSTFILPNYKSIPSIAAFIAILTVTGFAATCCWALFGSAFQKLFTTHKKVLNAIMALLLVYCAVSLAASAF